MLAQSLPVIPPAPKVHAKDLPTWRHLLTAQRNSIGLFPDYAFSVPFARRTLLGVEAVLINDPEGIRHVSGPNAANYVRPKTMRRVFRPLLGQGIFLAEGTEWRRQRRMLSPAFTPHNVGPLLPHFTAAADDLLRRLEGRFALPLRCRSLPCVPIGKSAPTCDLALRVVDGRPPNIATCPPSRSCRAIPEPPLGAMKVILVIGRSWPRTVCYASKPRIIQSAHPHT